MINLNTKQQNEINNKYVVSTYFIIYLFLLFFSDAALAAGTASTSYKPPQSPVYGSYKETVEDMKVKVHGGYIRMTRTRKSGKWGFNQRWSRVTRTSEPVLKVSATCTLNCPEDIIDTFNMDNSIAGGYIKYAKNGSIHDTSALYRDAVKYTRRTDDRYVSESSPKYTITERNTNLGYQDFLWEDGKGNWIDYNINGYIEAYGNKNGVTARFTYDASNRIIGISDALNKQVFWYEYGIGYIAIRDYTGRKIQYIYESKYVTTPGGGVYIKDLSKVIDVNGHTFEYIYSYGNKLIKKTDPEGREINVSRYGFSTTLTSVIDQDNVGTYYKYGYEKTSEEFYRQEKTTGGKVTETWMDKKADLIRKDINGITVYSMVRNGNNKIITDENGLKTTRYYDALENLTKILYPDNTNVSYAIDTKYSNITKETDENGNVTNFEYDSKGNLIRKIEAVGKPETRITEYDYDVYGNVTNIRRLADAKTALSETIMTYDDFGNVKTMQDAEGYTTTINSYNVLGNPTSVTDARGKNWSYEYDAKGNLIKVTDPLLRTTQYTYNKVDKLTKVIDTALRTTLYDYNNQHRLTKITYPDLSTYQYEYHSDGMVSKTIDESNITTQYKYDLAGRLIQMIDGNGNITKQVFNDVSDFKTGDFEQASKIIYPTYEMQFEYDKRQRSVINTVLDGGLPTVDKYSYDGLGNITRHTNADNKTETREYDAHNHLVKYTDYLQQITLADYDNRDNLIKLTDAKTQEHAFTYDRKNLRSSEIRPLGGTIQFTYDGAAKVISRLDAKNQKSEYDYDDLGRHTERRYFSAGSFITPKQTINFGYDNADNNTSWAISADTETDRNLSGSAAYNNRDRMTSQTTHYGPFSKAYTYDYYANGQKKTMTYPEGTIYSYAYDPAGLLNRVTIPGQGNISVNSKKWLAADKVTLPGGTTQNFTINNRLATTGISVKDPANNNISQQQNTLNALQNITQRVIDNDTYDYGYDDENRLTQVDKNTNPQANYGLDPVGNRITLNGSAQWQYNANNELLSQGGVNYAYDDNGNQTQRAEIGNTKNFFYDTVNHITKVEDESNALIARYAYDPFAKRLWKKTNTESTYYLYSNEGLIAEYNSAGALQQSYGYKPNSIWTTAPLFTQANGQYYYYQHDEPNAGKPQKLIAGNGAVAWAADYDAFGKATVTTENVKNNFRFAGQYFDAETGLHYNWNRYYDSETGRYVTSDPIGLLGGVNGYVYVYGDPVNFIDPIGLIRVKPGANVTNISGNISIAYPMIDSAVQTNSSHSEGVITSGNDSRHMNGSRHYTNDAIDVRGNNVTDEQMQDIADDIQDELGPDYDVEAEFYPDDPTNDHIHIEYDPKPRPVPDSVPNSCPIFRVT